MSIGIEEITDRSGRIEYVIGICGTPTDMANAECALRLMPEVRVSSINVKMRSTGPEWHFEARTFDRDTVMMLKLMYHE